jgi:putative selenate reductase
LAIKAVSQPEYFSKERKIFAKSSDYSILCAKCNNCVDVCPNRANKKVMIENKPVVIHYDSLCNECGNCSFSCIAGHIPYLEKVTIFNDAQSFHSSENEGFLIEEQNTLYRIKNDEEKDKIKHLEEYYEF